MQLILSDARMASTAILIVAGFQVVDGINAAVQGAFRGAGRQTLGGSLVFLAYYLIGIPSGCALAFSFHMGLHGLWYGVTMGLFVVATIGSMIHLRADWEHLAIEAIERLQLGR